MSEIKNQGKELDWDDEIEKDSSFVLFPEGIYSFKVEGFERGRSKGDGELPACKMAILKIRIYNGNQSIVLTEYLTLHSSLEWKVSEFFRSIGQKKEGERVKMNWNLVPGATGRCKVGIRKYKDNEYNAVKQFLPPEEKKFTPGQF